MTEPSTLAQAAMDKATRAEFKIDGHELLCLERYKSIEASLSRITKLVTWGGITLATMILGLLGWSLQEQYATNKTAIELLQKRETTTTINSVSQPPQTGPVQVFTPVVPAAAPAAP